MSANLSHTKKQGFTLIELLVVIAIIATLAVVVFVALDPVTRFAQARNSRRWNDVNSIMTAIHQYIVDNGGSYPAGMGNTLQQLGSCGAGGATLCTGASAACLDVASDLSRYLISMPIDPQNGSAATTGYSVIVNADGIVTVQACGAELTEVIEVSR